MHDRPAALESGTSADTQTAPRRIRLCIMATVDITIQWLFPGRLEYLAERGFDITVVIAPTSRAAEIESRGVRLHTAPLTRRITPGKDLRCLVHLWRFLRRERFDLVEVSTPKAALLGSIAARLAAVPRLVNLVLGLAYQQQSRLTARVLRLATWIPCRLADLNIGVSHSLREQVIRDGVCPAERIVVLGLGSTNGIDLARYHPSARENAAPLRAAHGIPADAVVFGFVGRITADKGIAELVEAFAALRRERHDAYLLLVGGYEQRDRPPQTVVATIASDPHIKHVGWQQDPVPFFAAMDVLVLPSYREGFATVLLEAAAMGLPTVTTNATGCHDAMRDQQTGLVVPVRDAQALKAALEHLAADPALRRRLGQEGRRWAEDHFDQRTMWRLYEEHYCGLVAAGARDPSARRPGARGPAA